MNHLMLIGCVVFSVGMCAVFSGCEKSSVANSDIRTNEVTDSQELSKADRIIDEYIDAELAPRLMTQGATRTEIQEMKQQLIKEFQKVPEAKRVEGAKYAIHEMIRMHGL